MAGANEALVEHKRHRSLRHAVDSVKLRLRPTDALVVMLLSTITLVVQQRGTATHPAAATP
jgi:hypothetical protein